MGIHEFDLARWLMADEVVEVHAYGSVYAHPTLASIGDMDSASSTSASRGATGAVELAATRRMGRTSERRSSRPGLRGSAPSATRVPRGWQRDRRHRGRCLTRRSHGSSGLAAQARVVEAILADRPVAVTGDGRAAFEIARRADRCSRAAGRGAAPP
jgi:predicted dehydrogenase